MKVKFDTFDKVNMFIRATTNLESYVFVKSGKYVVDGKSIMGLYSLDLSKVLEVDIDETVSGETEKLTRQLSALGILV